MKSLLMKEKFDGKQPAPRSTNARRAVVSSTTGIGSAGFAAMAPAPHSARASASSAARTSVPVSHSSSNDPASSSSLLLSPDPARPLVKRPRLVHAEMPTALGRFRLVHCRGESLAVNLLLTIPNSDHCW
jgi:hypothetical protein